VKKKFLVKKELTWGKKIFLILIKFIEIILKIIILMIIYKYIMKKDTQDFLKKN
jgi:hypothetical protein